MQGSLGLGDYLLTATAGIVASTQGAAGVPGCAAQRLLGSQPTMGGKACHRGGGMASRSLVDKGPGSYVPLSAAARMGQGRQVLAPA